MGGRHHPHFDGLRVFVAQGQAPAPPYILLQNATLTASGNTINAARIPVVTASGVTVYLDMALQFNTDANGNLTLATGYPRINGSTALLTSNFTAGTYVGPSTFLNGKAIIVVGGPGVAPGGATQWSLSAGPGADMCTTPLMANWYDGPIADNPNSARINSAKITSTALSYGIGGNEPCGNNTSGIIYGRWQSGSLLGFSQIGDTLTISSFTSSATDYSTAQDQIVFTRQ